MGRPQTKKRPVGRPPWIPSEEDLKKVEELAHLGMQKGQIGHYFGFNTTYWCELQSKFPELSEKMDLGRSKGVGTALSKLYTYVKQGDKEMIKYFIDRIGGYDPRVMQVNITNNNQRITQNVQNNINIGQMDDQSLKMLADQAQLLLDSNNDDPET